VDVDRYVSLEHEVAADIATELTGYRTKPSSSGMEQPQPRWR
jgi:hypothetical protein